MSQTLILCRPSGYCEQRNKCFRYRCDPSTTDRTHDFTDRQDGAARCMDYLPLYDSDDNLAPEDWQEPHECTT